MIDERPRVSVIIPSRDGEGEIGALVDCILAQSDAESVEVIVVDDGSEDGTAEEAQRAGARVVIRPPNNGGGNPAAARNLGARESLGELLLFLDADCLPGSRWLQRLVNALQQTGAGAVGGSFEPARDLELSARMDYYSGWYHFHGSRSAGWVPSQMPGNICLPRDLFLSTSGFTEEHPIAYAHEELAWQDELRQRGLRIWFEPTAVVRHRNRPGFANMLRRNYRWGFSAMESKRGLSVARLPWLYRYPRILIVLSPVSVILQTAYIVQCWIRARRLEPVALFPILLAARIAWTAGFIAAGRPSGEPGRARAGEVRPRWE
jgi:glycosyltransferase involved in cell wall biosynthesis